MDPKKKENTGEVFEKRIDSLYRDLDEPQQEECEDEEQEERDE